MRTCLIGLTLLIAGPAFADQLSFQSPSGNIKCVLSNFGAEQTAECHIQEAKPSFTTPPDGCDADWGNRFYVLDTGRGQRSCWSDAYFQPEGRILPYGASVSYGGVECRSAETGVTCMNREGGGFSIRRAEQVLF